MAASGPPNDALYGDPKSTLPASSMQSAMQDKPYLSCGSSVQHHLFFLSFLLRSLLDTDIDKLEKVGGQLKVQRISVQLLLRGNRLLPYLQSFATLCWTVLQQAFCCHRCCATYTQVGFTDFEFVVHVVPQHIMSYT
jgi:hypothetical protein